MSEAWPGSGPDSPRPDLAHRAHGPRTAGFAVVTVSDSRTEETDASGALIRGLLLEAGHSVAFYRVVPDDPGRVEATLREAVGAEGVEIVVLDGGTGISSRDGTFEVVSRLLDRRLDGFGELFRSLSFQQVGSAAMMSRAVGGLMGRTPVFSLPGSPRACELALKSLILPEVGHLLFESRR